MRAAARGLPLVLALVLALPAAAFAGGVFGDTGRHVWFGLALALAAALALWGAARRAPEAGSAAAMLVAGGSAGLWLTNPDLFFFLRFSRAPADALAALLLLAEAALAAVLLWRRRRTIAATATALGRGRLAVLLALPLLFSCSLNGFIVWGDLAGYLVHLAAAAAVTALHLALIAALFAAPDLEALGPGPALAGRLQRNLIWLLPLAVAAGAVLLQLLAYRGAPRVQDEVAYLFQARTFAAGMLRAPALPPGTEDAFSFYLLVADGTGWYSVTAPGWPAVLALGALLGVPWLVNPLLGALCVFLGMRIVPRLNLGSEAMVGLLLAASPMMIVLSASLMAHVLSLALLLGAWLLCLSTRDRIAAGRGAAGPVFAAGLLLGWLFLNRALEGLLFGVLTGLWLLVVLARSGGGLPAARRVLLPVAAFSLGCVLTGALIFPYDAAFTGHALLPPQVPYLDALWGPGTNAFGFGPGIGPPGRWGAIDLWPGHTPFEAVANTFNGLTYMSLDLFGWSWSSLLPLIAALLFGLRRPGVWLMAAVAAIVILIHAFYWAGSFFYIGPRYWFGAFLAFAVLAADGIGALSARAAPVVPGAARRMTIVVVLAALFGAVVFTGWRGTTRFSEGGRQMEALRAESARAVAEAGPDVLVLVPCAEMIDVGMMLNDPLRRPGRPLYGMARGEAADAALGAALGRPVVHSGDPLGQCRK